MDPTSHITKDLEDKWEVDAPNVTNSMVSSEMGATENADGRSPGKLDAVKNTDSKSEK